MYLAWVQALMGTVGSLFASEVLGWVPCVLCWYQRILLYPLTVILAVGILKRDKNLPLYVYPFTILGMAVALYQYLLQLNVIPEQLAPCGIGVSCTVRYVELFNFITLPLLSFLAFAFITVCMLIFQKSKTK